MVIAHHECSNSSCSSLKTILTIDSKMVYFNCWLINYYKIIYIILSFNFRLLVYHIYPIYSFINFDLLISFFSLFMSIPCSSIPDSFIFPNFEFDRLIYPISSLNYLLPPMNPSTPKFYFLIFILDTLYLMFS